MLSNKQKRQGKPLMTTRMLGEWTPADSLHYWFTTRISYSMILKYLKFCSFVPCSSWPENRGSKWNLSFRRIAMTNKDLDIKDVMAWINNVLRLGLLQEIILKKILWSFTSLQKLSRNIKN